MSDSNNRNSLTFYLTKEEKEYLVQKAKSKDMTTTAYIKSELFKNDNTQKPLIGMFQTDELINSNIERNRPVITYLSDEEYQYVKKLAGNASMAGFLRKILLTANNGKFVFDIKTDDIDDLRRHLGEFNMRIDGIIGALRYRSELYASDIANMKRLLNEVNENIKKSLSVVMTDRKYVRKKGVQHLQIQINKLLETMNKDGEIL